MHLHQLICCPGQCWLDIITELFNFNLIPFLFQTRDNALLYYIAVRPGATPNTTSFFDAANALDTNTTINKTAANTLIFILLFSLLNKYPVTSIAPWKARWRDTVHRCREWLLLSAFHILRPFGNLQPAQSAAPLEIPARMPSSRARRRAGDAGVVVGYFYNFIDYVLFRTAGTNPAPIPWILWRTWWTTGEHRRCLRLHRNRPEVFLPGFDNFGNSCNRPAGATPDTKISTLPSVSAQILQQLFCGESRDLPDFKLLQNNSARCCFCKLLCFLTAPGMPSAPGVKTSSAPKSAEAVCAPGSWYPHGQDQTVTARGGDKSQCNAGVSAGGFDDDGILFQNARFSASSIMAIRCGL